MRRKLELVFLRSDYASAPSVILARLSKTFTIIIFLGFQIMISSVFIFENMISLSFIFKFFSLLAIMISLCISYSDPSVALFYQFVPQFFGLSRKIMEDGTKVFQK